MYKYFLFRIKINTFVLFTKNLIDMKHFNENQLRIELSKRDISDEEIERHPNLLEIMQDYLIAYQNRGYNWSSRGETKKLNSRIKAELRIPEIKAEVAALDPAYLRIKLKMQGFTQHHINYFPELVEMKRERILIERLSENAKKGL